jgi:uncharacterized protein (DUF983 family)
MAKVRNTQYELGTAATRTGNGGISFLGLLTILFIGLKLTGHITWPWLWVLAPLWIPMAIVLALMLSVTGFFLVVMGGIFVYELFSKKLKK